MMIRPVLLVWVALSALGCDDGDTTTPPDPEPEPGIVDVAALVETRTLDADGQLIFRDEYSYDEGRATGFARHDHDDMLVAFVGFTYGEAGLLAAVEARRSLTTFFRDDYFHADGRVSGLTRFDEEGLVVRAYTLTWDEDTLVAIERSERRTGAMIDGRDEYYAREGAPSSVVRTDGERLTAAFAIEPGPDGQMAHIAATTPDGPSLVVEFDYDTETRVHPMPTPVLYPLTALDGTDLPASP